MIRSQLSSSAIFWLAQGIVGVLITGCGPAHPVLPPQPQAPKARAEVFREETSESDEADALTGVAKRLGLRIVPESAIGRGSPHFKSPDSNLNSGLPFNRTARSQGNQVSFFKALHLPHSEAAVPLQRKELFFVWPENSLGSPIVQAWVTHRMLDVNNRWTGDRRVVPARRDAIHQRWFVSILDFFGEPGCCSTHEADTQVLMVDLLFADQTRALIEVRFRVKGPNGGAELP